MSKITQLFEQLELFTDGEPPRHTLFVMGRLLGSPDQLLLIDPPADATERFSLPENTAVLFTGESEDIGLPLVQTQPGGVAHVGVGQHMLDIYSHATANIIFLPALGVLCGGRFGSDLLLPALAPRSDGSAELDSLRLLAQLVKGRKVTMYIPYTGSLATERMEIMTRLANDVSYLHSLRRVIPAAAQRGESLRDLQELIASLLPENRRSPADMLVHHKNVEQLYHTV